MLARRFTIVCLMTALFGIALSMLVEESARSRRHFVSGSTAAFCEPDCSTAPALL